MNTPKRIAYIFEEAKIFLTKDGRYYGFSEVDGKVKCLEAEQRGKRYFSSRRFVLIRKNRKKRLAWQPIARQERQFDSALIWQRFGKKQPAAVGRITALA